MFAKILKCMFIVKTGYIDSYKQRHRRNMDYVKQLEKKVYTINTINIFEVFYFECF